MADKVKLTPPMTDSKTPEWAVEAALEALKAARPAYDSGEQYDAHLASISQALLSAYERGRKEGVEEAAKVVEERDPHWPDDGDHIAAAIRQLLEVKG